MDQAWLAGAAPSVLDALLANGPVVVFWTSADPTDVEWRDYVSPNTEEVLGFPRTAIGDREFWLSRVHPDDQARVLETRHRALVDNQWPTRMTYRFRHGDGEYRWLESTTNLLPGPPVRLLGVVTDVTEQHLVEQAVHERERRLTAMIDGAPAQIYAKGLDGRFLLCNRAVLEVWGLASADVIGHTDEELWPEHADISRANDRQVAEGGEAIVADEVVTIDGRSCTYLSLKFPLRDEYGNVYGTAGVSADITDRARDLRELELAKEAAERASLAKSEFLSRMSHELRTPLNSILGFGQLLEMSDLADDEEDSLRQIMRAGRHLLDLINEVLDIARIEAGHLSVSLEAVSVEEIVKEACSLVGPTATDRGISVTFEQPTDDRYVAADRQRLLQILLNLLTNAIKYNRPSGSVTIRAVPVDNDRTRIEIIDTGRGIAPEHHGTVFEVFERLGAESSGVEGTGVGLSLAKHLIGLMNGEIGLTSAVGKGSTFWIELGQSTGPGPVDEVERMPPPPTTEQTLTVLCIEDNLANVDLMERVMATRPHVRLLTAIQGHLGLELARQHHPDLILLDLHLPDMSGGEVLQELRNDPSTEAIRTMILSADATPSQKSRMASLGADGYLTKPVDVRELLGLIDAQVPVERDD
jgi:PAS domain S-box-containing protein